MTPKKTDIQTPVQRRFRLWRQRYAPIVVWLVAVGALYFLIGEKPREIAAIGIVELRNVQVSPVMAGALHSLGVDLFDTVESGEPVALMDDTLVEAELLTAQAELARLRIALELQNDRLKFDATSRALDSQNDYRRFMLNEETARLDYLDRVVQQETDKVSLQRLELLVKRQENLLGNVIDVDTFDDTRLQRDLVKTRIAQNEEATKIAKDRIADAAKRLSDFEGWYGTEIQKSTDVVLIPLREELAVQEARINEVTMRRLALVLRAPLSGQVSSILRRSGETVLSGEPILTITDPNSTRVLAYVDEQNAHAITVGAQARIRPQFRQGEVITAKVKSHATQIADFPLSLWRSPITPRRGLSLLIGDLPEGHQYLPGEAVTVRVAIPSP